jgi:hypothetical protein
MDSCFYSFYNQIILFQILYIAVESGKVKISVQHIINSGIKYKSSKYNIVMSLNIR